MTTKGASFSYEEVIDLHTESDRVTVIGIHTPTGDTPRRMAPGLFSQFKKFRYLGCSVMMVPAATLPVDPLGVSYESGEVPHIDPRDMLNPILFHGCHGNDLGNILNRIYSANSVEGSDLSQILGTDSTTLWSMFNSEEGTGTIPDPGLSLLEALYYRALTDRTWQKANIQRGFKKRGLHPRVYTLATNMQLMGEALYSGRYNAPAPFEGDDATDPYLGDGFDVTDPSSNPVRFFTPRTQRLGWLDTRTVVGYDSKQSLGFIPDVIADSKIEGVIKDGTDSRCYRGFKNRRCH
uniref:Capsid protein n=1 Tax=Myotis mistacinus feces associated smacovirus 1 TaxID=3139999 RepID=A0AAU6S500_9VIRU